MAQQDKKQRQKLKREKKKHESRRRDSISPIRRLADGVGKTECYLSDDLATVGQVSILVYKQASGVAGAAGFLIDRGVVGLKDAWARMKVERREFDRMLDRSREKGMELEPVTVEVARGLVAGAVRWTQQHGMRLPAGWEKVAQLLGGVGDWSQADTSQFVKEFAGHPHDLRQRLVGESFDSFLNRGDVRIIFSDVAPYKKLGGGGPISFGEDGDEFEDDENFDEDDAEYKESSFENLLEIEKTTGLKAD